MNRTKPARYEYLGKLLTLAEWTHQTGIPSGTLRKRINAGWSVEKALSTPTASMGFNLKSKPLPQLVAFDLIEQYHRQLSDEMQRTMRRFMREFARTASAYAIDAVKCRGEVSNFSKDHPDQSFPIAEESDKLEFFQK